MGTLRTGLAGLVLLGAQPVSGSPVGRRSEAASPVERWSGAIAEAALRFGIPEPWIRRVMHAESGGRTMLGGRPIESRAGAMGLMQLMPGTWREMRIAHGLGKDPHEPRDNILAGAAYLRAMYDRFGYPGLFAAYNAGPARYAEHLGSGRRLPAETVAYVAAVAEGMAAEESAAGSTFSAPGPAPRRGLFVILRAAAPKSSASLANEAPPIPRSLFFSLRGQATGQE